MNKFLTHSLLAGISICASASSLHAQIIGINIQSSGGTALAPTDLAGAPGVRAANWNNIIGPTTTGGATTDSTVTDNTGATVSGLTLTFTGGSTNYGGTFQAFTPTGNDTTLYSNIFDQYDGTASTLSVSNIPYLTYNLFVYIYSDSGAPTRGGSITTNGLTYYIQGGVSNPASDGTGYVQSTDTTAIGSGDSGNYVEFTGLTSSTLNTSLLGMDTGDGTPRLKIAGFDIENTTPVSAPEPQTYVLMFVGALALVFMHRRRNASL